MVNSCIKLGEGMITTSRVPAIEGSHKGSPPSDAGEEATNALCANSLCYTCGPILFLNGLLRQVRATQHSKHGLSHKVDSAVDIPSHCNAFCFDLTTTLADLTSS